MIYQNGLALGKTGMISEEDKAKERAFAINTLQQLIEKEPEEKGFKGFSEKDADMLKFTVLYDEELTDKYLKEGNLNFQRLVYWFLSNVYYTASEEQTNGSFGILILELMRTVCHDYEERIKEDNEERYSYDTVSEVIPNEFSDEE